MAGLPARAVGRGVSALFLNDHDKVTIDARAHLLAKGRWSGEMDQVTKDGHCDRRADQLDACPG